MESCAALSPSRHRLAPLAGCTNAPAEIDALPDDDDVDPVVVDDLGASEERIEIGSNRADAVDEDDSAPRPERASDRHAQLRGAIGELASQLAARGLSTGLPRAEASSTAERLESGGPVAFGILFGALVAGSVAAAGLASEDSLSGGAQTALEVVALVFGGAAGAAIAVGVRALREHGYDCR